MFITVDNARAWAKWRDRRYQAMPNIVWSMTPEAELMDNALAPDAELKEVAVRSAIETERLMLRPLTADNAPQPPVVTDWASGHSSA